MRLIRRLGARDAASGAARTAHDGNALCGCLGKCRLRALRDAAIAHARVDDALATCLLGRRNEEAVVVGMRVEDGHARQRSDAFDGKRAMDRMAAQRTPVKDRFAVLHAAKQSHLRRAECIQ